MARLETFSFLGSLSGSAWQGILSQYWGPAGFISKTVTRVPNYVDERVAAPTGLTDAAVRNEVSEAIKANEAAGWPQSPTINDLFIVFTPTGTTWAEENSFCGYHQRIGAYSYAYVGWESKSGSCSHTVTLAHEYAEEVTDPYPNESWGLSRGNREELVDVCGAARGFLNGYEVPQIEDNYLGGCREADANPPQLTPEFITDEAAEIGSTTATLKGHAVPHGVDIKWFYFEWGTASVSEHRTSTTEFFPQKEPWNASTSISGLQSKTTYKCRLVVEDGGFPFNAQKGQIREFKTL